RARAEPLVLLTEDRAKRPPVVLSAVDEPRLLGECVGFPEMPWDHRADAVLRIPVVREQPGGGRDAEQREALDHGRMVLNTLRRGNVRIQSSRGWSNARMAGGLPRQYTGNGERPCGSWAEGRYSSGGRL